MDALQRRTRRIFAFRKGILALDTAPATLTARFRAVSVSPSPRSTDAYRAMLLGTPDLAASTSAVVLAPEAFVKPAGSRRGLPDVLRVAGILAGVRADTGCEPLSADGRESVTSGLDGLAARLSRLRGLGATFAVWSTSASATADRSALRMLTANSQAAARFAYICQDLGLVPVVRVGTRMRSGTGARRSAALAAALLSIRGHLEDLDVDLTAVVLSTECQPSAGSDPVAAGPLAVLPAGLGGVALTMGGHSPGGAADVVAAVCAGAPPWPVTFYLGREATQPALNAWRGRAAWVRAGQRALRAGLATASAALDGRRSSRSRAAEHTSRALVVAPLQRGGWSPSGQESHAEDGRRRTWGECLHPRGAARNLR